MEQITLNVKGMHCRSCAMRIQLEVEDLPGIGSVVANPQSDTVEVSFDSEKTSPADISAAISGAGFDVVG